MIDPVVQRVKSRAALPVLDLGTAPYLPVQALQATLRRAVVEGRIEGVLLLLEHPAVITLGSRGGPDDVMEIPSRESDEIPVCRSERGGAATLHAPGQLVSYPIIPLPGRNLHRYVTNLEEVLIMLLASHGVQASRSAGRPGLYVEDAKIASVGLRCEGWVASHGTSLNVSVDLRLFDHIVSCAEPGLKQTSISEVTGRRLPMPQLKTEYTSLFAKVFRRDLAPILSAGYAEVESLLGLRSASRTTER